MGLLHISWLTDGILDMDKLLSRSESRSKSWLAEASIFPGDLFTRLTGHWLSMSKVQRTALASQDRINKSVTN